MQDRISPFLITVLAIGIAILYIPILVLIGYSFNASALVSVWGGFSTSWYTQLLHNDQILDAAWLSLRIGVAVSTGSVILGTLAAVALVRFPVFRGRFMLTGMVNAPLVMPEIITGITQLLLFVWMLHVLSWPHRGLTTIVPALASSWLLSFTLSLDDLVISSFVSGPGASTLPMVIFSKVKLGVSPDVNALASLIICLVGVCVLIAGYLMRRTERDRLRDAQMAER